MFSFLFGIADREMRRILFLCSTTHEELPRNRAVYFLAGPITPHVQVVTVWFGLVGQVLRNSDLVPPSVPNTSTAVILTGNFYLITRTTFNGLKN